MNTKRTQRADEGDRYEKTGPFYLLTGSAQSFNNVHDMKFNPTEST